MIESTLKIAGGVETLGDTGFLQFFRVVSRDYGKPRTYIIIFINFPTVDGRNLKQPPGMVLKPYK